jgi:hypothetical protein
VSALADGTAANGMRWCIKDRVVTVSGWDGPRYVLEQAEFDAPTPEVAERFATQVLASRQKGKRK